MHVTCQIFESLELILVVVLIQLKTSLISACIVAFNIFLSMSHYGLLTGHALRPPPERNLISFHPQ